MAGQDNFNEELATFNLMTSNSIGKAISGMFSRMKCVGCLNEPEEQVFVLGNCFHRYCKNCIENYKGRSCKVCNVKSLFKEAGPDPFSTSLLSSLRELKEYIEVHGREFGIKSKSETSDDEPQEQDIVIDGYDELRLKIIGEELKTFKPVPHLSSLSQVKCGMKRKNLKIDESFRATKKMRTPEKVSHPKPKGSFVKKEEKPIENELPNLTQHSSGVMSPNNQNSDIYEVDKTDPPQLSPYISVKSRKSSKTIPPKPFSAVNAVHVGETRPNGESRSNGEPRSKGESVSKGGSVSNGTSTLDEIVLKTRNRKRPVVMKHIEKEEIKSNDLNVKPKVFTPLAKVKKEAKDETPRRTPASGSSRRRITSGNSSNTSIITGVASPSVDITKRNPKGETHLHIACRNGSVQNVEELLECGADVNATDFAGWTPLHDAIGGKGKALAISTIVTILCDAGANVNLLGDKDSTPLNAAAIKGFSAVCLTLLQFGASRNIRNGLGFLPRDMAANDEIRKLIDEFDGPYKNKIIVSEETLKSMSKFQKAVYFFTYDEKSIDNFKKGFNANVQTELDENVTHVIFPSGANGKVNLDFNYIFAICSGCIILTRKWIKDSLAKGELLEPKSYEITGCLGGNEKKSSSPPLHRSQMNKEKRLPGLFKGLNILIYKRTIYASPQFQIGKKELGKLIACGGGQVINREPNPDVVEPLLDSQCLHIGNPGNSKLTIMSHLVLYDGSNAPSKKLNMEHIKYLHVDWLIDSILNFKLSEPDPFL